MSTGAHTKGMLSGMLTAISYGANPLFAVPMIAAGIGINSILFYRYCLAAVIYGGFLICIKRRSLRINLREFAALLFLALLFSLSSITLFSSFQYIDVGISCTLLFIYPSLVALISCIFFGEKLSPRVLFAIAVATGGVVLLCRGDADAPLNMRGILLVLASALLYALYIVGVRRLKALSATRNDTLNFYVMLFGLGVYVVNLRFCADLQLLSSAFLWGCAILLALIPTIISLATLTIAIKLIGPTKTAILGALEPLTAIVIGVSLFHEKLSAGVVIGFLLIISGVLLIVTRAPQEYTPTDSPGS